MKNTITVTLRAFHVTAQDHQTGKEASITVVLTKEQLRAAQLVGQSSKELLKRLCERQGYSVIEIGKAARRTVSIDLDELWSRERPLTRWR